MMPHLPKPHPLILGERVVTARVCAGSQSAWAVGRHRLSPRPDRIMRSSALLLLAALAEIST